MGTKSEGPSPREPRPHSSQVDQGFSPHLDAGEVGMLPRRASLGAVNHMGSSFHILEAGSHCVHKARAWGGGPSSASRHQPLL